MKTIEVYSEQKGWIVVGVERSFDRAFETAKSLGDHLKDATVRVVDDNNGNVDWSSNGSLQHLRH